MAEYSISRRRNRLANKTGKKHLKLRHQNDGAEQSITESGKAHSLSKIIQQGSKRKDELMAKVQTKLTVGKTDDKFEKEADQIADKVVASKNLTSSTLIMSAKNSQNVQQVNVMNKVQRQEEEEAQTKTLVQKQAEESEEEEMQTKPLVQKQSDESEEEEMQAKPLVQKQSEESEEEEMQAKQAKPLVQKQPEESEEEEMQAKQAKPLVQKQSEESEEEELQTKSTQGQTNHKASKTVDANISAKINARKGSGEPLTPKIKHFMESQFNRDFSKVRIHKDFEANQLSQALSAQAFTIGQDIYFNGSRYDPESASGTHLLAHELTHVVHQQPSLKKKQSD